MAAQLRQPTGWFGKIVMSRVLNKVNRKIIDRTLELLEIEPTHKVLEVGFGGGTSLALLASKLTNGKAVGIDVSSEMVTYAENRFRSEITAGRIAVQRGDVMQLPFPEASFERAFTINTIYFWPDTTRGLQEIFRVLKPNGLAAISIRSKDKMEDKGVTRYNFRLFTKDEVAALMRSAGFRDVQIDHQDERYIYDQVVVIGRR